MMRVHRHLSVPISRSESLEISVTARTKHREDVFVEGTSNMTSDHQYVVYLDYDGCKAAFLMDEAAILQQKFSLGDGYIFRTSEVLPGSEFARFHMIIPERMSLARFQEVLAASSVEQGYRDSYRLNQHRSWVLRCGPKWDRPPPVYLGCAVSAFGNGGVKSQAHLNLLAKMGVPVSDVVMEPNDGLGTLGSLPPIVYYRTGNW